MGARNHRREQPCLRARDGALAQRRRHSGPDRARLPRSTRTNEGNQPGAAVDASDHLSDQPIASEEVVGVGLAERMQTLERIDADPGLLGGAGD